jgi:hypothetical protein
MALTRRGTHRCQNRIGWETQMTRRGRGEAETEARAPENAAYLMLTPWSEGIKDERASHRCVAVGNTRARAAKRECCFTLAGYSNAGVARAA